MVWLNARQRLGPAVDAGLDAEGEAVAQRVDLVDHHLGVAAPAHDVQHRAKNLLLHVGNGAQLKGLGLNQVGQHWRLRARHS